MKRFALAVALVLGGCNNLNRLLNTERATETKTAVADPVVVPVVVWGQSNATHDEVWQRLAARAAEIGVKLDVTNVARGNTASWDWATDWRGYGLPQALRAACEQKRPALVLSIQGESDSETTGPDFATNYRTILGIVKTAAPAARPYIALCSYGVVHQGDPRAGEEQIISEGLARRGPDVDRYRTAAYSSENGLHFNAAGDEKIGDEWFDILKATLVELRAVRS